jgi:hypothetical protein
LLRFCSCIAHRECEDGCIRAANCPDAVLKAPQASEVYCLGRCSLFSLGIVGLRWPVTAISCPMVYESESSALCGIGDQQAYRSETRITY